jgi:hypothetical protein
MFTFDKANRRARNMSEMMDRLGLDPQTFAHRRLGLDLTSAVRICQFCIADKVTIGLPARQNRWRRRRTSVPMQCFSSRRVLNRHKC